MCGWEVKLCDPLVSSLHTGHIRALKRCIVIKRYTNSRYFTVHRTRLTDCICCQFSCAALTEPDATSQTGKSNGGGGGVDREVWVCNSDGYVGHMCLLSLQSEPIVTLNTPVPGCNSRITCICAAPPAVTLQPQTPTRLR